MKTTHAASSAGPDDAHRRVTNRRMSPLQRQQWSRRLPLLPALLFTVVVTQFPFLLTVWYSVHEWDFLKPHSFKFNGLRNFSKPLQDPFFREAALNTLITTVGTVIIATIIGTFLAVLLDKKFFGQGFIRTLLITPFLIMPVAASLIWRHGFLDATYGFVNWILEGLDEVTKPIEFETARFEKIPFVHRIPNGEEKRELRDHDGEQQGGEQWQTPRPLLTLEGRHPAFGDLLMCVIRSSRGSGVCCFH